jgi:hypothetical protein
MILLQPYRLFYSYMLVWITAWSVSEAFQSLNAATKRISFSALNHRQQLVSPAAARRDNDNYDDDDDLNTNYWDDDPYDDQPQEQERTAPSDELEWETYSTPAGTAHILLPSSTLLPTCIIHFVGGTFFGSAANFWYRQLLEGLVQQCGVAVVATSIPATVLQSPLQHVALAKQVREQFEMAYESVLQDEYSDAALHDVPICAFGHSLGARLLVVLATLRQQKQTTTQQLKYGSMVLMSFSNHGAAAGIPGLTQLHQASVQTKQEYMQRRARAINNKREKSSRGSTSRQRRRRQRDYDDDYDDDDDMNSELGDLWNDLQGALKDQAIRFKEAVTPASETLEFYPSPQDLWDALIDKQRYSIPQTLLVQFDDDTMDQSSKLATALLPLTNLKFARLRGTHLTPVSPVANHGSSRVGRMIWKLLQRSDRSQDEALLEVRLTIASYINEIVIKASSKV